MNLIFPELRPHQPETLEQIISSSSKFIIVKAPTGFGKSWLPAQLTANGHKVLSNVGTKSLQVQYTNYDMSILYGKSNYHCLAQVALFGDQPTANDCEPKDKTFCQNNCPYPSARENFLNSDGGVLNYAKYLSDKFLIEEFEPEYLFLDEAHLLSDITLGHAGLIFNLQSKQLRKYNPFPFPTDLPQLLAYKKAITWLRELLSNMSKTRPLHPHRGGQLHSYRWHKLTTRKILTTLHFMRSMPESWYVECTEDKLSIKPLTARFHFTKFFDQAEKIILMSATISKHTLRELGITDYEWIEVPNKFSHLPTLIRQKYDPVYDLKCPKMGFNSSEADKHLQAIKIAKTLQERPQNDTGLIHTTSEFKALELADRLSKLSKRTFVVPNRDTSTEIIYQQWLTEKNNGKILIYWSAWEGWDVGKDNICIVAKVPFTPRRFEKDPRTKKSKPIGYDTHRYIYDTTASDSRVADKLIQAFGRIRRGNDCDYGPHKLVAIADGNWTRIRRYLGDDVFII